MTSDTFKQGMVELYQGELMGEVFFENMLSYFEEPDKQYCQSALKSFQVTASKSFHLAC
jgi:hypothetical protein